MPAVGSAAGSPSVGETRPRLIFAQVNLNGVGSQLTTLYARPMAGPATDLNH